MPEIRFFPGNDSVAIPDGYGSIQPGDRYLTCMVKKLCDERNVNCYSEMKKFRRKFTGAARYFAPVDVIDEAQRLRDATAAARAAQRKVSAGHREKKEAKYEQEFARRIRELFPSIPHSVPARIAAHACEVGSERVGRTRQIEFDRKVELAVVAFARHEYTDYEQRLREVFTTAGYDELREDIRGDVEEVVENWQMPKEDQK
jgi:hypothetical protein